MHPYLIESIPGLGMPLRAFGVMVAAGFVLGMWVLSKLVARHSADPEADVARYGEVHVWILAGILLGARLMYVIVEIAQGTGTGQAYVDEPWTILFIWQGGLVMYGGFFGGLALGAWKSKREGLRIPEALDYGLTSAFFGLAVGRIGCLLVGDDHGKIVPPEYADLPFPIVVRVPEILPDGSLFGAANAGQVLWATQPWMAINTLLLGFIGVWLLRRRRYGGQVALTLAALYSVGRYQIENFRGDSLRGLWFDDSLSTSQVVAIVCGSVAVLALVMLRGRTKSPAT